MTVPVSARNNPRDSGDARKPLGDAEIIAIVFGIISILVALATLVFAYKADQRQKRCRRCWRY
jgi:hypothetical protein